jgi:hypothetical protein
MSYNRPMLMRLLTTHRVPRTPFGPSERRTDGTPLAGNPAVCHMSAPASKAIFSDY